MPNMFAPNSSSPLTTKGDLFGFSTTNARVPVGADGLFLKADSSNSLGLSYASPAGAAISVTAITSSVTLTSDVDVVFVSGGTFSITLPNAASFTIKPITLVRTDNAITLPIRIVGLISGSTNWAFYTQNEMYQICTNGTTWNVLQHYAKTTWMNLGTNTITGITASPTKGNSPTQDTVWGMRDGKDLLIRHEFHNSTATGSAGGTGDYVFGVTPTGLSIDSSIVTFYAAAEGSGNWDSRNMVGSCQVVLVGNSDAVGPVVAYDANSVRLFVLNGSTSGPVGSAVYPITAAAQGYYSDCRIPITEFKP